MSASGLFCPTSGMAGHCFNGAARTSRNSAGCRQPWRLDVPLPRSRTHGWWNDGSYSCQLKHFIQQKQKSTETEHFYFPARSPGDFLLDFWSGCASVCWGDHTLQEATMLLASPLKTIDAQHYRHQQTLRSLGEAVLGKTLPNKVDTLLQHQSMLYAGRFTPWWLFSFKSCGPLDNNWHTPEVEFFPGLRGFRKILISHMLSPAKRTQSTRKQERVHATSFKQHPRHTGRSRSMGNT